MFYFLMIWGQGSSQEDRLRQVALRAVIDLINKRYNNKKATIFSSNYSLNSRINERGILEKTVDFV